MVSKIYGQNDSEQNVWTKEWLTKCVDLAKQRVMRIPTMLPIVYNLNIH